VAQEGKSIGELCGAYRLARRVVRGLAGTFLRGLGCDRLPAYPFVLWEISLEQLQHASNVELLSRLASKPVAEALLNRFGNLTNLAQASFAEMQQVRGVGQSKAAAIKSAFLLAQRLSRETYAESPVLDTPERVADLLREENRLYTVEHFQAVFLNTRRRLIAVQNICQGTLDRVLTTPRDVFAAAVARRAASLVLVHNHPSGDPTPSEADIKVTRDLVRAGHLLGIEVVDHVILGQRTAERTRDYVSLRELGYLTG